VEFVFELGHKRVVEMDRETGEKIHNTKLLGFFSSEEECRNVIPLYLQQPGFKNYPEDFVIKKVEADIDDFNDVIGDFKSLLFYSSHEYYDGEFDYITDLGYYSTYQKAKKSQLKYKREPEFSEHPDGFYIASFKIGRRGWTAGF